MRNAIVLAIVVIGGLMPLASPEESGFSRTQASQGGYCPPGLKYAAGACVASCPSGYADQGRVCVFVSYSR
jgi:hypothetical protein